MDGERFDRLARAAAAGTTRRGALRALAAAALAPLLDRLEPGGAAAADGRRSGAGVGGGGGNKRRGRRDRCEPKPRKRLCRNRCGQTSDGCGGHVDCGGCGKGEACRGGRCAKAACKPDCAGKQCGPAGCGGSCGTCPKGQRCAANGRCVAASCVPKTCADLGAECGAADDGCGGALSCGSCGDEKICQRNTCADGPCKPECRDKACGPDGCGGTCGACTGPQDVCQNGHCVCKPACAGKQCGPDGCGETCGACSMCEECRPDGTCQPLPDGTICGERADFGGTLRCCGGVCPTPNCLPPGQPCPGGDCNACCEPGNVTRPTVGWCGGAPGRCPIPLVEDFDETCPPPNQCAPNSPGCRPCFGLLICGEPGVKGGASGIRCGSDADCAVHANARCHCGVCCRPAGVPAAFLEQGCSDCCSGRCDPENPTLCA